MLRPGCGLDCVPGLAPPIVCTSATFQTPSTGDFACACAWTLPAIDAATMNASDRRVMRAPFDTKRKNERSVGIRFDSGAGVKDTVSFRVRVTSFYR